jgi:hypothetical protein
VKSESVSRHRLYLLYYCFTSVYLLYYCFTDVRLGPQRSQTKVVRENLNPIFDHTCRLFVCESDVLREIEVHVLDWGQVP